MRLGGDFYVLHAAGRLGNRQAISAQTFEMKRDGFLNLPSGLFDRVASRYTAGQVRHVSRVVAVPFFAELDDLRSQFATSSSQLPDSLEDNRSQFATGSHGGRRYLPWAFTEHGALMAANILRSVRAVQMSVFVVRAFVRLREEVAANTSVLARLAEIDRKLLQHDVVLLDIYQKLLPLLQPSPDPPKRRIGFHSDDD